MSRCLINACRNGRAAEHVVGTPRPDQSGYFGEHRGTMMTHSSDSAAGRAGDRATAGIGQAVATSLRRGFE